MPPELQSSESVASFAARIKQKYPAYADLEDEELVRRLLEKYPVYREQVNLEPAAAPPQPSATAPRPAAQPETFIERHPALAKGMDILGGVAEKAGLIPSVADITSEKYVESIHRWHEEAVKAQREGKPEPPFPKKPEGAEIKIPSTFKAAMDVPLLPLGEMAPPVPKGAISVPGAEEALAMGGGLADIVQSFTTPRNVAIIGSMVALGPYRLAQRLVEAGFAAEMAPAAAEQISAGYDQWLEGNKTAAIRTWTGGAATAALAAFLGAKTVKAKGAELPAKAEARAEIRPSEAPGAKERRTLPPAPPEAVKAPPAPTEAAAGVLPGMERAVEAQKAGAARVEAERLGGEFAQPIEERAGQGIEAAPIFRGTEAAPQREMFVGREGALRPTAKAQTAAAQRELVSPLGIERRGGGFFDEFGDEIKVGGRVVDSLGRPAEVREIVPAEDVLPIRAEMQPSLARGYVVGRFAGGAREEIPLGDLTVKRRGRPQEVGRPATEAERRRRIGVSVRSVGTEEMGRLRHGTPSREELGFPPEKTSLFSNPLIPISEAYTRLVGRPAWEKAIGLLWRMTPDFIQRNIRERPSLIRERVPSGEAFLEARGEERGFIAEKVEKGFALGERLQKGLKQEEQEMLGRLVKGEAKAEDLQKIRNEPRWNDAIEAAKEARSEFDNLGSQAVVQGLLKDETFFRNYGKYVPRMYRKYELDYDAMIQRFGEKKPTRLDLTRFKQRKDIPEHIRMLMGEILEPAYPVAKGIAQIAHDVGNVRLFNKVADNPEWASKDMQSLWDVGKNPAEFVEMPTTGKLGRLSGMWVNKWIADDLNQIIRSRTELEKIADALVGEWKYSKVILNPATHGRNLMSNWVLAHLGGLPMTRGDIYYRALVELRKKGPLYDEALAASQGKIRRGTFAAAEMNALLDSWNKSSGGLGDRLAAISQALRAGKGSEAIQQVRVSQTKPGRKLGELYQAEEVWFKMSKYIHNREKGMKPREAWADAEKWLFDYTEVPKLVEWARRSPAGAPFITFTYKALPVVAESMVTAPWRMAGILASLYYLNEKSAELLGMSEQEKRRVEASLPEKMKGKVLGVSKFLMLPFKDKYGQIQYLDLTYILPWGDIGETGGLGSEIPGVRKLGGLTRQVPVVGSPLIQAIAEIGLNKSSYTGKEIYQPWESTAESSKKISLYLYRQAFPSLAPGGYGETRLRKAITQEPDYMGRTSSIPTAAASTLLGLKTTPIDPRMQRIYRHSEFRRTMEDIDMQIGKVRRNRGMKLSEKHTEIRRLRNIKRELRQKYLKGLSGVNPPETPRTERGEQEIPSGL